MLKAEQIIPFLNHSDHEVRRLAVENLTAGFDAGKATAEDLWRSIDLYGFEESSPCYHALSQLPHTEASYHRLLQEIQREKSKDVRYYLDSALCSLGWELFSAHHEEILGIVHLERSVRRHCETRLRREEASFDELWSRLRLHCWKHRKKSLSEIHERSRMRLIDVMIRRYPFEAIDRTMDRLANGPKYGWLGVFSCEILGKLFYRPAIGLLLEKSTGRNGDALPRAAIDALVGMADAEIVAHLEKLYSDGDWTRRIRICEAFGNIRLAESEAAILRLLEMEEHLDLATFLAGGLCKLCVDANSLEVVRNMFVEDRYAPGVSDLDMELFPAAIMVGYEPPEMPVWRKKAVIERIKFRRLTSDFRKTYSEVESLMSRDGSTDAESGLAEEAPYSYSEPVMPIRRDAPKVGRNDPCPCGSGKKYKKCCLGKT